MTGSVRLREISRGKDTRLQLIDDPVVNGRTQWFDEVACQRGSAELKGMQHADVWVQPMLMGAHDGVSLSERVTQRHQHIEVAPEKWSS